MIEVKIIADSIYGDKDRITTFEIEYPRFIHAELMTHRLFSRNAASSRAISISKMINNVQASPAHPLVWGLDQKGMQAKDTHDSPASCLYSWRKAMESAVFHARALQKLGLHKQIVNRVLEPFQVMKTVVTATEFDNFFWLRCHTDAQPEIEILARAMHKAFEESEPNVLYGRDWHTPYFRDGYWAYGEETTTPLEDALKISSSCCAQVSYLVLDDSLEKAYAIYDKLVDSEPVHASPFEHPATPCLAYKEYWSEQEGTTHIDREGNIWSGNLKNWVQYRQLIDNNVCTRYSGDT